MCCLEYVEMMCSIFPCLIRSRTKAAGEQAEFRRRLSTIEFRNSSGSSWSAKAQPGVASAGRGGKLRFALVPIYFKWKQELKLQKSFFD